MESYELRICLMHGCEVGRTIHVLHCRGWDETAELIEQLGYDVVDESEDGHVLYLDGGDE